MKVVNKKKSNRSLRIDAGINLPMLLMSKLYGRFVVLYVVLEMALRIILVIHPSLSTTKFSFIELAGIFGLGAVNDFCVATLMFLPIFLFCLSTGRWKFGRPQGWILLGVLVAATAYLKFGAGWLEEFNRGVHRISFWVMLFWVVSFALRMFVPKVRKGWLRFWIAVIIAIELGAIVMNVVGEWLFWDEFGVRYNFIAVDYLVYTTEVVGNIVESYPMGLICSAVVVIVALLEFFLFGDLIKASASMESKGWRLQMSSAYGILAVASMLLLPLLQKGQDTPNVYYNELRASGPYSFYRAFFMNKLDYHQFYPTISDVEMTEMEGQVTTDSTQGTHIKPDIILITMESLSADYMERFGNKDGLTPALDSLYNLGLAFDNMFAAGNRTVRGLEALTLSRPPSPGESIIKREDNTGYRSIADALDREGYRKVFVYGGDSYFDNMREFFSGLDYEILDSKAFDDKDVQFRTIWGICDEDVYGRVIREMDERPDKSKPTFFHIMTTSNHRPYTYPDGRISIPPTEKRREGGVMYSDYALGKFINESSKRDWFDNTVFVIVTDHCASSAGSVEIPLENYHIPCLVYSPRLFKPERVGKVASQIDVMPTVFARLGWDPDSNIYGRNILSDSYNGRAFVSTYQDMGYLENDTLTLLSPVGRIRQFRLAPTDENPMALSEIEADKGSRAARKAIYYYQSSSERR